MLKDHPPIQSSYEFVSLEDLVPQDHLVRKIDKAVDFSFIHDLVSDLYCSNNGRPAFDPTKMFKLLLIGYIFGIRSERQLIKEVQVNTAYRWFVGFGLLEKIPDASTLSQNRRRRFNESDVYQQIFDEIVIQAMDKGLIKGHHLYTDSTHIKANANKGKWVEKQGRVNSKDYIQALEQSVTEDRKSHGKKPLKAKEQKPETKIIKQSTTDPDSGYMVRDGKPKGFFYLDHRTVDGYCNFITDVHVTAGNVHDSIPYLSRIDRQVERFSLKPTAVGLDAGYFTASICKGIEDRKLYGVISYRRPNHKKGYFYKRQYTYHHQGDYYECPEGQKLSYSTTDRIGYKHYKSDPKVCTNCPVKSQCTQSANSQKTVTRHVWEESKERINKHRLSAVGKQIYKRRKETVERSFADAKELHQYRYARYRGINKVKAQCLMVAAAQNIKKMALMAA